MPLKIDSDVLLQFRNKNTQQVMDSGDLYVNKNGNVITVYQDENDDGDLCEFVNKEDSIEAIVTEL